MSEINLREGAKAAILRIKQRVTEENFNPTHLEAAQLLARLEDYFTRFTTHHEILLGAALPGEAEAHIQLKEEIYDEYDSLMVRLRELSGRPAVAIDSSVRSQLVENRLDPIKLPTFDGRWENWLEFKDLFEALVHRRDDWDTTMKLTRLRQCVSAEAVPMMEGMYTGGYKGMWKKLTKRYDQHRKLVQSHVKRLYDLPDYPSLSQRIVRDVIDSMRSSIRALEVMGHRDKEWNVWLYPLIMRRLPQEASNHWALTHKGNELPKISEMLEEIETYSDTLSTRDSVSAFFPKKPLKTNSRVHSFASRPTPNPRESQVSCVNCQQPHLLRKCPQFIDSSIDRRLEIVLDAKCCLICFSPTHETVRCRWSGCQRCQQKHHRMLCRVQAAPAEAEFDRPPINHFPAPQ